MPFDSAKVDLVLQYALLLAGQEDDYVNRDLGPIHLIKYVYLADLAFARRHQGTIFTGSDWTFYKFGPWAQAVNARIAPALKALNADEKVFPSDYQDRESWVRWCKRDEYLLDQRDRTLPFEIKVELRSAIHKFGHDTPSLLDYVYKTRPMLRAAPGESLDFTLAACESSPVGAADSAPEPMTERRRKKLRERMRVLQQQSKMLSATKKLVKPPPPRYDDVYSSGMQWLDSMAGQALAEGTLTVEFADDVWKSSTRNGEELS